jgi:hypothetical protein
MMKYKNNNMRNNNIGVFLFSFLLSSFLLFPSCEYEEIASADYPAGKVYLPGVYGSLVYAIDDTSPTFSTPTSGSTYRYRINNEANELVIPLAVYRSGINPGGDISVSVSVNTEIVAGLVADETLEPGVALLPAGQYSLDATVEMSKGQVTAPFNLSVDLGFLKNHIPQRYALGITIACAGQECNPDLNTVVVLINTEILNP